MSEIKTEQVHSEPALEQVQSPIVNLEKQDKESNHDEKHPQTRKKRIRTTKKKLHKKDPEQVKLGKLQQLNHRREAHWDNRFSNDTIPDIFKSKQKKMKVTFLRKVGSPVRSAYDELRAFAPQKLPNITTHHTEKVAKKPEQSFKVRSITRKHQRKQEPRVSSQARNRTIEPSSSKGEDRPVDKTKEKLMIQLIEKTNKHQIPQFYRELLRDAIEALKSKKSKGVRQFLEEEVASIGSNDNIVTHIQARIAERQSLAAKLKDESDPCKVAEQLQKVSIGLVQQVLQFNTKWESTLKKLGIPRKVRFLHQGENYLLRMHRDTSDIDSDGETDPFVVKLIQQKEEKASKDQSELSLKVRACELLLLEEELRRDIK